MPRRIYLKEDGLGGSVAPVGYVTLGVEGGKLSQLDDTGTQSEIGGGGSSIERIDVVSFGVESGFSSELPLGSKGNWGDLKYLLWEVVDRDKNVLSTDLDYSNEIKTGFVTFLDSLCNSGNNETDKSISVKGYYYKNQSREKFRIVGRNYAYWSLVGLKNHSRMKNGREIDTYVDKSINSQNLMDYLNSEYGIGLDGQGLMFTSNKEKYVNSTKIYSTLVGKSGLNRWGITSGGDYLKLGWGGASQSLSNDLQFSKTSLADKIIGLDRNGNVYDWQVGDSVEQASSIVLNKLKVFTTDYNSEGSEGPFLTAHLARPIGQDTFLLCHNSQISVDDKVLLISESSKGTSIIQNITVHETLDNNGFGSDLSTDENKVVKNRWGSIWLENIGKGSGLTKNVTKNSLMINNQTGLDRGNSSKWRVAWGKNGIYTISDDYIYIRGTGFLIVGYVNGEK